jgi:hypothetical protein
MTSAASDLATIGSNVNAAHMVAAARTAAVVPAAADEVSTSIAHLFSQHAAGYQALAGQAAAFQEQFVQHLTAGAFSYAGIEAKLASLLQDFRVNLTSLVVTVAEAPGGALLLLPFVLLGAGGFIVASPVLLPALFIILPAGLLLLLVATGRFN